jgi:hypothetical protein
MRIGQWETPRLRGPAPSRRSAVVEHDHDPVTGLDVGDIAANRLDDAAGLHARDKGRFGLHLVKALHQQAVGIIDADSFGPNTTSSGPGSGSGQVPGNSRLESGPYSGQTIAFMTDHTFSCV